MILKIVQRQWKPRRPLEEIAEKRDFPGFDADFYVRMYQDVAQSNRDPLEHFISHGVREDRDPNEFFFSAWYRSRYMAGISIEHPAIQHFVEVGERLGYRPNPFFEPAFLREKLDVSGSASSILAYAIQNTRELDRTCSWFSRTFYREAYPDHSNGFDNPERHFFAHGWREGRLPSADHKVIPNDSLLVERTALTAVVDSFEIQGQSLTVVRQGLAAGIIGQILHQSRHDSRVLAPGHLAIQNLPSYSGDDLKRRDLYDYAQLIEGVQRNPGLVIITGRLGIGGAEKYLSEFVETTVHDTGLSVLVITTNAEQRDDQDALRLPMLVGLRRADILSARPVLRRTWKPSLVLALLMMYLRPANIIVVNSEIGLDMLARYGRGLSQLARCAATFFSEAPNAMGAPFASRYLNSVLQNANVISDNQVAIDQFDRRTAGAFNERLFCIPQPVQVASRAMFERHLAVRTARRDGRRSRIFWMSRWEPFKATDVMRHLFQQADECDFVVFGPGMDEATVAELPDNVRYRGPVYSIEELKVQEYDCFIFSSKFEGMPNVVLEIAGWGVPIVASDVGGLKETFRSDEISFVDMSGAASEIANRFHQCIREIRTISGEAFQDKVRRARNAVMSRHSFKAFAQRVRAYLGVDGAESNSGNMRGDRDV